MSLRGIFQFSDFTRLAPGGLPESLAAITRVLAPPSDKRAQQPWEERLGAGRVNRTGKPQADLHEEAVRN